MKINSCSGLEQPAPAFVFNIPLFAGILLVIVFILVIIGAYNEWEKYKK